MKTKIIYGLLLSSLILMASCTDMDEKLYDKISGDDYPKTEAEIQTVVGGAYASLRGINDKDAGGTICYPTCEFVFFLNECVSDEAIIPTRGKTDWYDGGVYQDLQLHTWKTNSIPIWSAWKYCFHGIASVNTVIYQVDKSELTEQGKELAKAELRGLRAYYYSLLIDWFGDVPISTSFDEKELPAKSTRKQVFGFIETELKEVMDMLPTGVRYGGFTQNVANSILARLYLNAEVYTGTPRWQDCITACDKISGYVLEPDYFASFKIENEKSKEIIFAIPYDHKQGTLGNYLASMTYHYLQTQAFSVDGSYPWAANGISAKPGLYSSFDEKDVRRKSLLIGDQISLATGSVILMDNGNPLSYTEEISNFKGSLPNEGARLHKYEVSADDQWDRDNDWVLIRYAEILMMKAEANFRLGYDVNALTFVNQIRNRAGLANLTTLTLADLDAEWKHEFVFEGNRRTVNIRFGTFFEPWWEKPSTPRYRAVYPIPSAVLSLNPNLVQNPNY